MVAIDAHNLTPPGVPLKRVLKGKDGFTKVLREINSGVQVGLTNFMRIVTANTEDMRLIELREGEEPPISVQMSRPRMFRLRNVYIVAQYEEEN